MRLQKNIYPNFLLKGLSIVLFSLFTTISCEEGETPDPNPPNPPQPPVETPKGSGIGEARDINSFDLVAEMGVGWNLGNSFDVTSRDKTFWGNPLPNKSIIDVVRTMGFKTLRIPITWGFNQSAAAPYTIENNYLAVVKKVVDYGFSNGMHVIINVHHDNEWSKPIATEAEEAKARLSSLWTQVSEYFKAYNDSLIFETLNEPRLEGSPEEWSGGTTEGRSFINDFHKAAVDAIRASGGNNAKRHIMIPTWAASTVQAAMDELVIPNDDPKVIISLHTYFPWPFAGEANRGWGSDQDKADLEAEFDRIRQKWIVDEGRPVILGEWGSVEENPLNTRQEYAAFYAKEAAERDLLTIVWDDGGRFRLLNRRALSWDFSNLAFTIVNNSQ
ncbi:MAG: glycoside hydrolase family 5 protein [Bacteroidota bacterium]